MVGQLIRTVNAPTRDIFLLAGQSNAQCNFTTLAGVPGYISTDAGVRIWNVASQALQTMQAGVNTFQGGNGTGADNWGAEVNFSYRKRLAFPSESICWVKYAVGATQLAYTSNFDTWSPTEILSTGYYNILITNALAAAAAIRAEGFYPRFRGMIWMQGEYDAAQQKGDGGVIAAQYNTNLTNLIASVRSALASPNLTFIIPRISLNWENPSAAVRQAEQDVAVADGNAFWINTDGYALSSSHFGNPGTPSLGDDCWTAYSTRAHLP